MTMEKFRELRSASEVTALVQRGVIIPAPGQVAIGREVALEQISPGAVLHPFCRIHGAATRIGPGAEIGPSGGVTLEDSWVGARAMIGTLGPVTLKEVACGPGTALGCGVAEQAVLLGREAGGADFNTGYGFRIRKGSLYEEDANSAQSTDTKMTILFPWVTLGSNVNWCDLLMAGGVGPTVGAFSELGSGAIHYNFTPRGDKATGSLFGNVVEGVFLNQPRLFLGGNGSMVGPLTAEFGAMTGAGGRYGKSLRAGLNPSLEAVGGARDLELEVYGSVKRIYESQIFFIAELAALEAWYAQARPVVAQGREELAEIYARGRKVVTINIAERIAQLGGVAARMERSAALLEKRGTPDDRISQQRALLENWPRIEAALKNYTTHQTELPPRLREALEAGTVTHGAVYTRVVQGLSQEARLAGRDWLRGIRDGLATQQLLGEVPGLPGPK